MIQSSELEIVKQVTKELLEKLGVVGFSVEVNSAFLPDQNDALKEGKNILDIYIVMEDPSLFIGQQGQTLFELQRLLKIIISKKLKKDFYLALDINDYKKKKIEYIKSLAQQVANEAAESREVKVLPPMPSYERRIVHAELSQRTDVTTESQGEGFDRYVVIKPKPTS